MAKTILERVKISLQQFHMENVTDDTTGETTSQIVYDNEDINPVLEEMIQANTDELLSKIEPPDSKVESITTKFASCIVELTKYDFCKLGGDYQASHSENNITRSWNSKEDIYGYYGVNECRYVKILS